VRIDAEHLSGARKLHNSRDIQGFNPNPHGPRFKLRIRKACNLQSETRGLQLRECERKLSQLSP